MSLPLVTQERIEAMLDALELKHGRDDDGDIVFGFDEFTAYIKVLSIKGNENEHLMFFAYWAGVLKQADDYEKAPFVALNLNAEYQCPKVIVEQGSEQQYRFRMESVLPAIQLGLTDNQLKSFIVNSLKATGAVCEVLAETFPHLVTWDDGEEE